jgi:tRNA G10  N-methylase Trm11
MLPPKLAQMMINMAVGDVLQGPQLQEQGRGQGWSRDESQDHSQSQPPRPRLLDPFCGTGVLLQEALLLGCSVYGTDLSDKMIRYTHDNLTWLHDTFHLANASDVSQNRTSGTADFLLADGDAMTYQWQKPLDAVVSEAYLGQPFSAPPSPEKLAQVQKNCQHIITAFLTNISQQIDTGTPVVLAVPAWRTANGDYSHLPLTQTIEKYGFKRLPLTTVDSRRLMYARPEQVVARELLLVEKT